MKNCFTLQLALLTFTGFCQHKDARVTRVIDGDTFVAEWNGKNHHCRISNIDAPELKQNYGQQAYRNLNALIIGKDLQLDSLRKDMYGRVIILARIGNKRLDSLIVREGWAWHYVNYSTDAVIKYCMDSAIAESKGLWICGANKVCPPWLYRKYNYRNRVKYCKGC